ncbi:hypothetical protein [Chitinophaga eiseniae]|uniref:Uncharacterized protein n=1 Tax=Chitinophaga eiseniae TaxID=634771 RepID=A0A847SV52_9BACT|nr:hypothetical protein [Chitinophaga eiseniae]NLR82268.1 hypothetical protein [Chitinophaga eiseniae]
MGITGIRVLDDGNVIRIINPTGTELLVHKTQVRTIDTVQDTIRIDMGEGALHHVYIKYTDVTEPQLPDISSLLAAVKNMLFQKITISGGGVGGDATAANQQVQNDLLTNIETTMVEIKSILYGNKILDAPLRIDESVPNVIYYGYAIAGTTSDKPEWAIKRVTRTGDLYVYEWAGGNQASVNIWDRRYDLSYQKLAG